MTMNDDDEMEAEWADAMSPRRPTVNILDLVLPSLLSMDRPLRRRWLTALNAGQFDLRRMDPDPDLDPDDPGIPDEKFEFFVLLYLTDDGEFTSIRGAGTRQNWTERSLPFRLKSQRKRVMRGACPGHLAGSHPLSVGDHGQAHPLERQGLETVDRGCARGGHGP
jgi:hypothetical protein